MRSKAQSYEEFAEQAQKQCLDWALKQIQKGQNPVDVMEQMSKKLIERLNYPILASIKNLHTVEFDVEASRKAYEEQYLKFRKPVADHVTDD